MNWQTILSFSESADWVLLTAFHSLWISFAVFIIMHLRKFRSPVVRSAWCTFTLILLLLLPLITWVIPKFEVRARSTTNPAVEMNVTSVDAPAPLVNRLLDMDTPLPRARIGLLKAAMNQFGLLWIAVALACVGRLLYQLAFLKGFCSGMQEIRDDRISGLLKESERSFRFSREPRFFTSHRLEGPISTGLWTPLVILPAKLYQNVGEKELRGILLHELAHIYHRDHVLGLLQRVSKALYWWNPFVYGVCNSLSVAREEVSDNYAISGMGSAAGYARLLVSLVEKISLISRMPCTAGMGSPYESLEARIRNILSKERDMRVKINKPIATLILLVCVLLGGVVIVGSQVAVFGVSQIPTAEKKATEPQTASTTMAPLRVDGKFMLNKLIHKVDPIYPEPALKGRVQGKVKLTVTVNEEGLVSEVQAADGHPLLNEAAITAVKQWKFSMPVIPGGVTGGQVVVPGAVVGNKIGRAAPVAPPPPPKSVRKPGVAVVDPKEFAQRVPVITTIVISFHLGKNNSPYFVYSGS